MKYDGLKENSISEKKAIYGLNKIEKKLNYKIFYESIIYILPISIIISDNVIKTLIYSFLLLVIGIQFVIYIKQNKKIFNKHEKNFYYNVIRDGKKKKINKTEIVVGDIILFEKYDEVCADVMILESNNLIVDETIYDKSRRTVQKNENFSTVNSTLKPNFLYTNSIIINGSAVCKVIGTGLNTELSKQIRDNKINDKYTNFKNKFAKLYIILNVISLLLFIIGIFSNIKLLISLSFIISTLFSYVLYQNIYYKILLYLGDKNIIVKDIKTLYDIYKAKNLFLTNKDINNNKMSIVKIETNNIDEDTFKSYCSLAISNKNITNELDDNTHKSYNLIKSFNKHKLNFNIYEKTGKLYLFVSGNAESFFDICNIDLNKKFDINNKKNEYNKDGIKLTCIGHQQIDNIEDDIFKYNISYDGYICTTNYCNNKIIDNLNQLSKNYNLYLFMDDSKQFTQNYFKDMYFIDSKYVISKKEYRLIEDKNIYDYLNNIHIYSKFDMKTIYDMYKHFDNSIIHSNNYELNINNLEKYTLINKYINNIFKKIKVLLMFSILSLIVLVILSFKLLPEYILIIKFILIVLSIVYIKKVE